MIAEKHHGKCCPTASPRLDTQREVSAKIADERLQTIGELASDARCDRFTLAVVFSEHELTIFHSLQSGPFSSKQRDVGGLLRKFGETNGKIKGLKYSKVKRGLGRSMAVSQQACADSKCWRTKGLAEVISMMNAAPVWKE